MEPWDKRPHVNYIIVEVRERDKPKGYSSDAAMIRHILHKELEESSIDYTDMLIRYDKFQDWGGNHNYWFEVHKIFGKIVEPFRGKNG